jgi:predicted ATPase
MERLKIDNFAGIRSMDFEFKPISVLIGPQGSGKSITIKLLYFFKSFFYEIINTILFEKSMQEFDTKQKENFVQFFPKESWAKDDFEIIYTINETIISIKKNKNNLVFNYSESLNNIVKRGRTIYENEEKSNLENSYLSSLGFKKKIRKTLLDFLKKEIHANSFSKRFLLFKGGYYFILKCFTETTMAV